MVTSNEPLTVAALNQLPFAEAKALFSQCCSAEAWQDLMVSSRPYDDYSAVLLAAEQHWAVMTEADYLQAFDGHPKIGDVQSLRKKYATTKALAANEQSGVQQASDETLQGLAKANQNYLQRFGFIFIICATGKSADEMLQALLARIDNPRALELKIAAAEQMKITQIRLAKALMD